jgi:hypothetical protein
MDDKQPVEYTWSYSAMDTFKQCPQKYYRLNVKKDIARPATSEAQMYGLRVHKAAEDYFRSDTPVPEEFAFMRRPLETLRAKEGEKLCEYKMGLTRGLQPCGFFDKNVWWRGVADLIVLQDDRAWVVDYKTGKSAKFADTKQLELMALGVFAHFPTVRKVKGGLLFVVAHDFVKADFTRHEESVYWRPWLDDTQRLEKSLELDVWNPRPNFTCSKWCPVTDCTHNGKSQGR